MAGSPNSKQRAGARRFQYHLVATPAQIGKARQHDGVTLTEPCALRPVLRDLGLDDHEDLLVTRKGQAIFEQSVPRQSMHQDVDFPRDGALAGKGCERQAVGQISRAVHRGRAQLSQIDGIAVHEGGDAPVRLHLQGEMTVQSGGDDGRDLPGRLFPGSAHERAAFQETCLSGVRQERREFAFQPRAIQQSKPHGNIVKPARREAAIEMPQAWNEHANDRDLNVGPRLVEHEEIVTCLGRDLDTGIHLIARVVVNLKAGSRRNDRIVAWDQERIIFQAQRIDTVKRSASRRCRRPSCRST